MTHLPKRQSFKEDLEFLGRHAGELIVLSDSSGREQIAVSPKIQGRVMTSSADGGDGLSFGWINYNLLSSGKTLEKINPYGGEDRLWFGPEAGQFGIFFGRNGPFNMDNYKVPACIDTEPFRLIEKAQKEIALESNMAFENYSGTEFQLKVRRNIRIFERQIAADMLGVSLGENLKMVAFESDNLLTNTGDSPWKKKTGMLSIWILGLFNASPSTTIVIPVADGPERKLGPMVNDAYFGKVPEDRLAVSDGTVYFKADSNFRSKIGFSPKRAKRFAGSFDAEHRILTIVQYNKPSPSLPYINSMWEIQKDPYDGDVINAYNDGPSSPGEEQLGRFYELETSSPAAALEPGQTIQHIHRTIHFQGTDSDLDPIAKAILNTSIRDIESALPAQTGKTL